MPTASSTKLKSNTRKPKTW